MISLAEFAAAASGGCAVVALAEWAQMSVERRAGAASSPAPDASGQRLRSLFGRFTALAAPRELALLVDAAGNPAGYSPSEVMGVKLVSTAVGLSIALAAASALGPGRAALLVTIGPVAGFLLPDLLLRRRAGQRRRLLEAELPVVADRILLAVRAGLPLGRALAGAGEYGRGLLALELGLADARVRLGASRAEALAQLERSCPLPEVVALVAAIGRADRYGVALEPMLAALAAGARADRQRRITEQAQGAAPKIQLIVALLLVPAAICCVAAGMIAGLGGS